jgi:hypothetical protein
MAVEIASRSSVVHGATWHARVPRGWHVALAVTVWLAASGASCPRVLQQYTQPIPRALPPSAPLSQVIDLVNANSAKVQSLSTPRATITMAGFPSLSANIAFKRPRSLRVVAQKFGPQLDMGSNDELLWFWIRQSEPPALFFCRHEQYGASAARQIIPVEPQWLIEAFGVVTFDTAQPIEGPFPVGNGRLEVRSKGSTAGPGTSRITIIDDSRGVVLEDHVYDSKGTRLASSIMSKHVRDPASDVILPRHLEISWPTTKLDLSVDIPDLQINQLSGDPQLFIKPVYSGYNEIDLANPPAPLVPNANGPASAPATARY